MNVVMTMFLRLRKLYLQGSNQEVQFPFLSENYGNAPATPDNNGAAM